MTELCSRLTPYVDFYSFLKVISNVKICENFTKELNATSRIKSKILKFNGRRANRIQHFLADRCFVDLYFVNEHWIINDEYDNLKRLETLGEAALRRKCIIISWDFKIFRSHKKNL